MQVTRYLCDHCDMEMPPVPRFTDSGTVDVAARDVVHVDGPHGVSAVRVVFEQAVTLQRFDLCAACYGLFVGRAAGAVRSQISLTPAR